MLQILKEQKERVLERITQYHLREWRGSDGNVFFISDGYPGLWLEHTYDPVVWAQYDPTQRKIPVNQIRLFLSYQKEDGQLPCYIWKDAIGYSQTQECVSFAALCLETVKMNPDEPEFLTECYEGCAKWDAWLEAHRMTTQNGLIEVFGGFDTGHDNSYRLHGTKYHGCCPQDDAGVAPTDDELFPMVGIDMSAIFYGSRVALSEMAIMLGKEEEAAEWAQKAEFVRKRMMESCYDPQTEFFYDLDKNGNQRKIKTIAITNVLNEGVMDDELANRVIERHMFNEKEFWAPIPFPSLAMNEGYWFKNLDGNSWNYYSQGLTALRTLRWMVRYGKEEQMKEVMRRWIEAWVKDGKFDLGQELDPITGVPSVSSPRYSSAMLYFLVAIRHLYGI